MGKGVREDAFSFSGRNRAFCIRFFDVVLRMALRVRLIFPCCHDTDESTIFSNSYCRGLIKFWMIYLIRSVRKTNIFRSLIKRNHLQPAIEMNLVRMTIPNKPNSRNQRYVKI